MAIKVKVGVELDSKSVKASLDSTLKSLESKKIKLNIDMTSLKQLQTTITQLSKAMSGLKMPGINTSGASNSVNNMVAATKQVNNELKNQAVTMSNLKQSINEEYSIRKKLVSATGETKTELEGQLKVVESQTKAYENNLIQQGKLTTGSKERLQIDNQIAKKQREYAETTVKYQQSMDKLKNDAISNLNTKGMSTKEIDDYKNKIESINTVSLDQVKNEISAVNKEMANGQKSAQEMAEGLKRTGDSMASAGMNIMKAFAIPAAGLGMGVKAFSDFSYEMDRVQAVSGATSAEMEKLTNMAKQMGLETMYSAKESAQALTYMGMAGWDASEMMAGLPSVINLAVASGEDLGRVSDILTDGLTAFQMTAQDAGRFADVLAMSANKSNTSVSMLGESFKYVGSVSGAMGYSIEDVAVQLGLLALKKVA